MTTPPPRKQSRHGDGSIYWDKSKGSYVGSISLGLKPDGSRNRPTVRGRTKKEVRASLKELKEDYEEGLELGDNYTVEQACKDFLERGLKGRSPKTVSKLESFLSTHIIPSLGKARLKRLTSENVEDFLDELTSTHATRTIREVLGTLRRIIRYAQSRNKVRRNVAELVDAPIGTAGRPSNAMTLEQAKAILRASNGLWIQAYIAVSVFTGVRTEETRPLRWAHTHLNPVEGEVCSCGQKHLRTLAPHIEVWRSVRLGGDTKTPKSRRTIALPDFVVKLLREYREALLKGLSQRGIDPEHVEYVFASCANTIRDASNVRRDLQAVVKKASVPGSWTPRELRHTFVSIMSDQGATDQMIADLVGHSDTGTTRRVYRKQLRPVITHGAELLDTAFGKDFLADG